MYLIFSVAKLCSEAQIGQILPQNLDMWEACGEIDVIPLLGGRRDFREITGFKPWISNKSTEILINTSAESFNF